MFWNYSVRMNNNNHRLLYEAMICRQCEAAAAAAFRVPLAAVRSHSFRTCWRHISGSGRI